MTTNDSRNDESTSGKLEEGFLPSFENAVRTASSLHCKYLPKLNIIMSDEMKKLIEIELSYEQQFLSLAALKIARPNVSSQTIDLR